MEQARYPEYLQSIEKSNLFFERGQPDKAKHLLEKALKECQRAGDLPSEAYITTSLGIACGALGSNREAKELMDRAMAICVRFQDPDFNASFFSHMGTVYKNLGDLNGALGLFDQALRISRQNGSNQEIEAIILTNSAIVYSRLTNYRKAIEVGEVALSLARSIDDKVSIARAAGNLGVSYSELGDYQKMLEYAEIALPINIENDDPVGVGTQLWNKAFALSNLGRMDEAIY